MNGKWIKELADKTGQMITLETTDGVTREGRLSALRGRSIKLDGKDVEIIIGLELNGDPYDDIPFDRIATIASVD